MIERINSSFFKKYIPSVYFVLLVFLYIYVVYLQYAPIFYEDQFIHIGFLKDLANHDFNFSNFLSVFGEHLFPGYSLIAAINYYFFSISLAFETWLTVIFNIAAAFIIFNYWKKTGYTQNYLGGLTALLIMLSSIQYPMKSMALAANLSVILLICIFYLLLINRRGFLLYSTLLLYVIFFAGAYSAGFVISYIAYLLVKSIEEKKLFLELKVSAYILILYGIYYSILIFKGNADVVSSHVFEPLKSLNFAVVMTGSSVLGKAIFEAGKSIYLYYFVGVFLLFAAGYAVKLACEMKDNIYVRILLLLLVYSLSIIAIASYARYQNGLELAMGQWYQSHIKYLPVATCLIVGFLSNHKKISKVILILIISFSMLGYYYEYRKAPYAKIWKQNISENVYDYLADDQIKFDDMELSRFYWPIGWTKEGLDFFYHKRLAYFKTPVSFGLTFDGWLLKGERFRVICPSDSKNISIILDNIDEKNLNAISKTHILKSTDFGVLLNYSFPREKYNLYEINSVDLLPTITPNNGDQRALIFHVKSFVCR